MAEPTERDRERAAEMATPVTLQPVFSDEARVLNAYQARSLIAQALADERARIVARLRASAEGWRGRGMDGIAYAIEGEARELEADQ